MARFVAQRILRLVAVLVTITVVSFFFMHAIPGSPVTVRLGEHATPQAVAQLNAQLGLDRPWYVQLAKYLWAVAHGDLGSSIFDQQPVAAKLLQYFPATVELALAAMIFAVAVGVPAGVLAAVRHGSALDAAIMVLVLVGVSVPVFWLGWMLVYLFAVVPGRWHLDLFPISGRLSMIYTVRPMTHLLILDALLEGDPAAAANALWHLVLPALTLGTIPLAIIAKMTRSGMLEVLSSDYVRTARAKGLGERAVVLRHGLRNALIPILTVVGLQTGLLLGGAVLTESIFAWPGVGRLAFEAISNRDFPVVNGCILLFAVTFVVVNTCVDVLYAAVNPRIRYG
ncbi:MAG TPA: ABC transporter permease [Candidatus Dormibacteraeota bacterium]|nr:ABC transporter permease [Candidatus Dormibacteraeota bacterium]